MVFLILIPIILIFVLVFCIFNKEEYISNVCPALQRIKFDFWGHDQVVLHEHNIRKPSGTFNFLKDQAKREQFLSTISDFMSRTKFSVHATIVKKIDLAKKYVDPKNPYALAMRFGLERSFYYLNSLKQGTDITHIIVESRGSKEDAELELEFRRICDGNNQANQKLPFELIMTPKTANSSGLQLADLIARPIGIKHLRPTQPNQSYEIIEKKFFRNPNGIVDGWGIKLFP